MAPYRRGSYGMVRDWISRIDWFLFGAAFFISLLGLATMRSFSSENFFFQKQIVWIVLAVIVFSLASLPSYRFLRRSQIIAILYGGSLLLLASVFVLGSVVKGSQTRLSVGLFAVQPADPMKLALVLILAKYFARRHVEIRHIRHIIISGAYAGAAFICVFLQPDFGSAITMASIWLGMVLVAGISWRHLAALFVIVMVASVGVWHFALLPYQKARILTFVHPLADIHGTGYNAYQSTVAVGSGQLTGKGIGYGTQSKLEFLPEYQTDFIFAAYAEEWGFIGVVLFLGLYLILIYRILSIAIRGETTFETLFGVGVAIYFISQATVHVGMDMGLLPITGTTLPFMSYGGSHLVTEYLILGILSAMRRRAKPSLQARDETELIGAI